MTDNLGATAPDPGADRATATQTALTSLVARFAQQWQTSGEPPDLSAHLPAEPALRRSALIELIKVDLHERWQRDTDAPRLADYREQFPELAAAPLPPDLVYEEINARSRRDHHAVDLGEYEQDYPIQMARITEGFEDLPPSAPGLRTTMLADPTALDALDTINPGATVDDFDLLLPLGQGAFARVFLARQRSMGRLVAVKISHDRGSEPQTLAQLDHDHIVRVFDQRQITDQRLKLMYMQYVPGGTLLGVLRMLRRTPPAQRDGKLLLEAIDATTTGGVLEPQPSPTRSELARLSWPETVAWLGSRLAAALDYANHRGILHRDLKPANVLLTADGQPKLADFNISFSRHLPGANPVAYFGGSLPYMAPEQLEACHPNLDTTAADLDTRADLYALAVVLWELLTGRLPFDDGHDAGETEESLQAMIDRRRTPIADHFEADLPPDTPALLRHALLTCLAPDPADRYATGADLAQQLDLSQDRAARDLVDPPTHSLRARLRMRPMPVVTLSSLLGHLLAGLYLGSHNLRLIRDALGADAAHQMVRLGIVMIAIAYPIAIAALMYWCRSVFVVPNGLRRGRQFDAATLARARADTLACGDRIAVATFAGWLAALGVFLVKLHTLGDVSAGITTSLIACNLVAACVAVVYTYFPVTYFVLRWYYPGLVAAGGTTPADAAMLRRMVHRSRIYLGVAACVPLIGVPAGLVFLTPDQQQTVIGPIVGLCVGGLFAFLITLRTFYLLESDLNALDRILDPHPHS
ncbi:protein kinase [Nocardia sp. 852002-51101_SCH5132738]|uniref:serine/threonine-protein kinase n=1 Tax=Nocardia TaxID=1817 RepID=UPI0007EA13E8|nr:MULTISPECIES: serine/threonine-protein kinase [Nocardia]MBF6276511.1 serine/threonine protein kinase [Nocardia nova]OBA50145.1 protein kinase [Nocardia sp. 852002-51101_SCH5132738]